MEDRLRDPGAVEDPIERDVYVTVLPDAPAAARPTAAAADDDTDLDFVDAVVPASIASTPGDDSLLRGLGLPAAVDRSTAPQGEIGLRYGLMAGFPDRDVDETVVEAGAAAVAARYDAALRARDAATRSSDYPGQPAGTVPLEEDDAASS